MRSLPRGWGLITSPKKNYVVVYNRKDGKNDALARAVAQRIEQIRAQMFEKHYPPSKPVKDVSVVRICADLDEYHAYGGPYGTSGTWSPQDNEIVLYDASESKKSE